MRTILALAACAALAACGADGEPEQPTRGAPSGSGVTISGDASIGVTF